MPSPSSRSSVPREERAARHRDRQPVAHPSASSAACARCTRCTSSADAAGGQVAPEAADQLVVAAAAAEREAHGGVVDLEDRRRCSSRARARGRGRRSPGRPRRARPAGRGARAGRRARRCRRGRAPRGRRAAAAAARAGRARPGARPEPVHLALESRRGRAATGSRAPAGAPPRPPRTSRAGCGRARRRRCPIRWRRRPASSSAASVSATTSASPSAPGTPISSTPAWRNSRGSPTPRSVARQACAK